jgi:putative phosphoesterase
MRLGIMSDSHDRVPAIGDMLKRFASGGVGLVMHAGDYCSPFSLVPFADANLPLLGIFGRNDGDPEGLKESAGRSVGAELYESPHSFEIGGNRIMLVYDLGDVRTRSLKAHRIVIHGATHEYQVRTLGDTLLINPGETCGWLTGNCTGVILDLDTQAVERIDL